MKRYHNQCSASFQEFDGGDWVRYEDSQEAIKEKDKGIAELVEYANSMRKQLSRHHDLMDSDGMYFDTEKILSKYMK